MAPRVVRFVRRRYVNHFPKIHRAVTNGRDNLDGLVERYVATVALIARRSMRKAPKRPRTRFGTLKAYSRNSRRYGRYYWQKGMYSRPGQPPFWVDHTGTGRRGRASLRNIQYHRVGIARSSHGGGYTRWRVGPVMLPARRGQTPVPVLHEHGGTVRKRYNSYVDRRGQRIRRPVAFTARYPRRPYMAPAMRLAKRYARNGRHYIDRLNNLAGLRATRRAS